MNSVTINTRPTTTGPILDPRLSRANPTAALNAVIVAALEVAEQNVKECYSGVRQLPPATYRMVKPKYAEGETWRYCASPALSHLVDALRAITRDIPEARRDLACALSDEIIPQDRSASLTDESILATGHKPAGDAS